MPAEARPSSRSPRGEAARSLAMEDAEELQAPLPDPEVPVWEGAGLPPGKGSYEGFMGQLRTQRAFLEQFLYPDPPPQNGPRGPRELAAGMPLEAARALLMRPGPTGLPWQELPAHLACVAMALRLFALLLPGQVGEDACELFCKKSHSDAAGGIAAERLLEVALAAGLSASRVSSAAESLKAMAKNHPVVCCGILEDYVAVLADPISGEEAEQEVGHHCIMVVGGDLLGASFVVFDPWGPQGGEFVYWSAHEADKASPTAWIQLAPTTEAK
mmetsp:Transcript_82274/g.156385  ORF Transcript_82274/g.156385 Transcript_82274/m.156385 type:complete len:272 (+) Transcript_82274:81-896(+)